MTGSYRVWTLVLGLMLILSGVCRAQDTEQQKVGIPVYDPVSKRYFALMRSPPESTYWQTVDAAAKSLAYKGVHGRLAVVDSFEVHDFLLRTFHPNQYQYIWIGLKYECRARKLVWSDGQPFKRDGFAAWDKNWKQDPYFCSDKNFPGDWGNVAYTPQFTWIAMGRHKGYDWYFIEYPTGHP